MSWPTGDGASSLQVAVRLLVPRDMWYSQLVVGLLTQLPYADSWDAVGTVTANQAAAIFQKVLETVSVQAVTTGQIVCFPADNMQYINQTPADGASQWLKCDGAELSQIAYAQLFAVIGTTFGSNPGTFFLPDLRGRTVIDAGAGAGLTPRALADTLGEESHTLNTGEIPAHSHSESAAAPTVIAIGAGVPAPSATPIPGVTGLMGGGGAHNNMQPSIALFYYIQAFP